MARTTFPKGTRVTYKICHGPACRCSFRGYPGMKGTVLRNDKKFVVVNFEGVVAGVLTRQIHFRKETVTGHLERIDRPAPRRRATRTEEACSSQSTSSAS